MNRAIGLLTSRIDNNYNMTMWNGIYNGARSKNYNLITYRGDSIKIDKRTGTLSGNVVYDNIDFDQIDGFLLISTTISNEVTPEIYENFCSKLKSKPIVSIGQAPSFVNRCLIDNSSGFYNLVTHLIKEHGCKSFAYLSGPEMSKESIIRFNAFKKSLSDNNLEFDKELLYYGNFQIDLAKEGMKKLIDKKIGFDAVVAANDDMALAAIELLTEMGYKIPDDIKVAGFDDVPNSMLSSPPLSTVRQPIYLQGFRAVNNLIDLIENKKLPLEEYIQTSTVIRQSCGCGNGKTRKKSLSVEFKSEYEFNEIKKSEIITRIKDLMKNSINDSTIEKIGVLINLFDKALSGNDDSYIDTLREYIDGENENSLIEIWQELLIKIETYFIEIISEKEFQRLNELKEKREEMINDKIMILQSKKFVHSNEENRGLREVLQALGFSFKITDIHNTMANKFKSQINISSGYLLFFDDDEGTKSRLMAGFDKNGPIDINSHPDPFPTKLLIQGGKKNLSENSYYICAINFDNKDVGLIVLDTGTLTGFIYESVAAQLISSIWGSSLLKTSSEAEKSIKQRTEKIESLVKPMISLIKQATDVIAEKMKTVTALNDISRNSAEKIYQTSEIIRSISDKFTEMMDIISIIDDISATVKLVSINASIESAHAGQYGSGFNVIAKEIKKLSESTKKNAENISQTLRSVIDMIKISIDTSSESAASFGEQEKAVKEILDTLQTISENLKNLDSSSNEILAVMETD